MAAFERLHDRDAAEPVALGTRPSYVLAWTERTARPLPQGSAAWTDTVLHSILLMYVVPCMDNT